MGWGGTKLGLPGQGREALGEEEGGRGAQPHENPEAEKPGVWMGQRKPAGVKGGTDGDVRAQRLALGWTHVIAI